MGKVIGFGAATGKKAAATFEAVNEPIKPIIEAMWKMSPGDLSDFCRAVCQSVEYIIRTKEYRYFSDSTDLAVLIGSNYVFKVKGCNPPTNQQRKAAAAAAGPKNRQPQADRMHRKQIKEQEAQRMKRQNICPKCGREYTEPPAISRADNKTEICPECGIREALAAAQIDEKTTAEIMQRIREEREKGKHQTQKGE